MLYCSVVGFNPCQLKSPKQGVSSHAMNVAVCAKSSLFSRTQCVLFISLQTFRRLLLSKCQDEFENRSRATEGICMMLLLSYSLWQFGLAGNVVGRINEVNQRRARLVLGWVTVFKTGKPSVCNQPSRPTQPGHPSAGRQNEYWR